MVFADTVALFLRLFATAVIHGVIIGMMPIIPIQLSRASFTGHVRFYVNSIRRMGHDIFTSVSI